MQGSFTSESANKFLQLMSEAGYPVENNLNGASRENFSSGVSRTVDPWEGNIAEFGETRGEYIENYDFARCVRPDGSVYGTRGKCKKGAETSEKTSPKAGKPAPTEENLHSLMKKYRDLDRKIESATAKLGRMLKGKKYEGLRKEAEEKIKKLKAARKKIAENREIFNKQLDEEARRTGTVRELMPKNWNPGFSEEENYDFTRCVRPDGSSYGSRGKCRKGTETAKDQEPESSVRKENYSWGTLVKVSKGHEYSAILHPEHQDQLRKLKDGESTKFEDEQGKKWGAIRRGDSIHLVGGDRSYGDKPHKLSFNRSRLESAAGAKTKTPKLKKELTPDEKWMQGRLNTLKTLKGKSKQELLSILNQNRKIHGLTEKDSVRDLKGAILSSIHGNDSPSEIKEKRAAQMARIQRQRESQRQRQEEQSAIDQLSQMLPKGEKIMDSLGEISIATGGSK